MAKRNNNKLFGFTERLSSVQQYTHWYVALSGGIDSTALLHVAVQALKKLHNNDPQGSFPRLTAIHVDHQIMPQHSQWLEHCRALCASLEVTFCSEVVEVNPSGGGLEQAARISRYQVFKKYMQQDSVLLMGHHANDQAETLLLRLLRGAGVSGAASIPKSRSIQHGIIFRPFLKLTRQQLENYVHQHGLPYITDNSNENTKLDRNYIRHTILPPLLQRWPQLIKTFSRFARHAAEAKSLLHDLAKIDLQAIKISSCYGEILSIIELKKLARRRQSNVLRYWLSYYDLSVTEVQLQQVLHLIENNRSDTMVELKSIVSGEHVLDIINLCVFQDKVYLYNKNRLEAALKQTYCFAVTKKNRHYRIAEIAKIELSIDKSTVQNKQLKQGYYHIAPRKKSVFCKTNGQHKPLKKLLQELSVPSWLRGVYPIIYHGDEVAAVGDLLICDGFLADDNDNADEGSVDSGWVIKLDWLNYFSGGLD